MRKTKPYPQCNAHGCINLSTTIIMGPISGYPMWVCHEHSWARNTEQPEPVKDTET